MTKEILYKEFLQDIRELVTTNYDDPLIREVQETHMKNLLLEKYSPTLGFNGGDIKRFMDIVRKKDNLSEDTPVEEDTGEDLLERLKADSFEETTYFSPLGLPKSGVILLAARSKVGKTLFAWDLVKGVAAKGTFLGLPVMKGDIVLFMLEESVSSMNTKLRTLGFNNPLVKNQLEHHKVTLYNTLDISRSLQRLENIIKSKRPILIVIDSLRRVLINSKVEETSSRWAEPVLYLQSLACKYNILIVVIHHTNKDNATAGTSKSIIEIQDKLSGSSALTGNTSGAWYLTPAPKDQEDGDRYLYTVTRDFPSRAFHIRSQKQDSVISWTLVKELGVDENVKKLEKKILVHIKALQRNVYKKELIDKFYSDRFILEEALERLVDYGLVSNNQDERRQIYYYISEHSKKLWSQVDSFNKQLSYYSLAEEIMTAATKSKKELIVAIDKYKHEFPRIKKCFSMTDKILLSYVSSPDEYHYNIYKDRISGLYIKIMIITLKPDQERIYKILGSDSLDEPIETTVFNKILHPQLTKDALLNKLDSMELEKLFQYSPFVKEEPTEKDFTQADEKVIVVEDAEVVENVIDIEQL